MPKAPSSLPWKKLPAKASEAGFSRRLSVARGFIPGILLAALCALPTAALPSTQDWIQVETENFTVFSNASEDHTRQVALDLETLRAVLVRYLEGAKVESPLPTYIYIFREDRDFEPYKQQVNGEPSSVSGFFAGHPHGNYVAIDGDPRKEPQRIIYHEYLHYFARLNLPGLPLWLNEGLAEYYSTFEVKGSEARIGLPVEEHVRWLRRSDPLPFSRLLTTEITSDTYQGRTRRRSFYSTSWALVHYLLSEAERRDQLYDYLDRLEEGAEPSEAFQEAFGVAFTTLEREVTRYAGRRHFSYIPLDLAADGGELRVPRETAVRPLGRAEVYYRLGDLLAHTESEKGINGAEAARHFRAALEADPYHSGAYAGLGFLEDQQGSYGQALAYYERALELSDEDFLLPYLYGWTLLRSLGMDDGFFALDLGEQERAVVRRAVVSFESSLERNPHFPESYAGLGAALTFEEEPTPRAAAVLEKALRLLPERVDVAFNLVVVLARLGRVEAARGVLEGTIVPQAEPEVVSQARDALTVARLDSVERLAVRGRWAEGVAVLEEILGELENAELAAQVEFQLREMRRVWHHNRFAESYNGAVTLSNEGRTSEAVALLEELLQGGTLTSSQRQSAERLLQRLLKRLP